jgi:thiosulfate/3-mercaptopyruvate sulfurtransferase
MVNIEDVHRVAYALTNKASYSQILDARAPARFNGEVDEPRKGVRSGSISGSKNIFFQELIN